MIVIPRPAAGEYHAVYDRYLARLDGDDALAALRRAAVETPRRLAGLDEARALSRYAPGKWSVKEVVGHVADAERVFACRALRIARADATPLPGFDENAYVPAGGFDARPLASIVDEFRAVRAATLALFDGLDAAAAARLGTASGARVSVRALAWIIAAHEHHHLAILRERYGIGG